MKFISTRDSKVKVSGAEAVVKGLSDEGGLFVPESFPTVSPEEIAAMADMEYPRISEFVVGKYLPELKDKLGEYTDKAYARFDGEPVPVVKLDENTFVMELWHGPTHAFKDVALTLLPHLLVGSKSVLGANEKTLILVATSGDTGKAALEGFAGVDGTDVIVFYPSEGVSNLQKLQMMTQRGDNVFVTGITGNFDDAQNAVKAIFTDETAKAKIKEYGYEFSSANSINFGRLVPQIAYYFSTYAAMLGGGEIKYGDKVNFCVPSGNFGDILAGYYAKRMGLPVGKLICASNCNNVLTDFIETGVYDKVREFHKTTSPSMDILISSNLERLLLELCNRDCERVAGYMAALKETGKYTISEAELEKLQADFYGAFAGEDEVKATIAECFDESGYIMDTHTAVAMAVLEKYREETEDDTPCVVLSTASPYKFVNSVLDAIGEKTEDDELKALKSLEKATALPLPESLSCLPAMEKRFTSVIDKADSLKTVYEYIERKSR